MVSPIDKDKTTILLVSRGFFKLLHRNRWLEDCSEAILQGIPFIYIYT